MKKLKFVLTPLLAISFLTNCGGNKKPSLLETPLTFTCIDAGDDDRASINLRMTGIVSPAHTINLLYKLVRNGEAEPKEWSPVDGADENGDFVVEGERISLIKRLVLPNTRDPYLRKGDKIMFKGNNPDGFSFMDDRGAFIMSFMTGPIGGQDMFNVSGNIMSLLDSNNFASLTSIPDKFCFDLLFSPFPDDNEKEYAFNVVSAEDLLLPANTLTERCYSEMFYKCHTLKVPPLELPSMTLASGCYGNMFSFCELMDTTPSLPATTLSEYCYMEIFEGCESLEVSPILPATTLAKNCYYNMFAKCKKLNYIKVGFGTPGSDTWVDENYTALWFHEASTDVDVTPTFYWKGKGGTPTWERDENHVPANWIIQSW